MSFQQLQSKLQQHGQSHVLRFWETLDSDQQDRLQTQLDDIDLEQVASLVAGADEPIDFAAMAARATPPPAVKADGSGAAWSNQDARQRGEQALRDGQIGAVLVAGGQGTRLGFDQPKGMFPIGPVSQRTLFQFFADRLIAIGEHYGVDIPLYIMTSEATDADTKAYFETNDYLGLNRDNVRIFKQGTMPAVDAQTGKLLMASQDSLALSPDGHGGTVKALAKSGSLDDAESRGIKHLAYFQVDNPLVGLCDPTFIGHHLMSQSEMTSQVVRKRYPMEKVGNMVVVDGQMQIIEYSDLPQSAAEAVDDEGQTRIWAGSIAVHVLDLAFLRRMSQNADALPFHRANKKVPFVNESDVLVEPDAPNAVKFERFIFDLLPSAKNAFVVEALPRDAFAPVKNADGAETDTPKLSRQAISDLHASWLQKAGATLAPGVMVEINPRYSLFPEQLAEKLNANLQISSDQYFDV
ncbi:UTP--glucose-1-phosphate uridylyltransferase [Planctomycetes bacterium K23_9]|uniref:Putative uridylyltransferase n=1 Tax=Stieleria marina TaxID=1930275 RepID=A0A517P1M3_9BACT|nr:putative uridylyltransferase [Planctomycetes bacterium K23_9]